MHLSALVALALGASAAPTQNYQGCVDDAAARLPYCDATLSLDARLDDLLGRLSLEEKVRTITPQPDLGPTCDDHTGGVDALGLPSYMWLVETNTAVASACLAEGKCATNFIGPMGLGASFNRTSWRLKGSVLGNEMRAFNNLGWHRAIDPVPNEKIGLTGYGPNVNIARDPRFGRNSELPGEDPLLNGEYASQMVQGMQEEDAAGHPKMLAYLKHLTACECVCVCVSRTSEPPTYP